ncbi:hypothetical protein Gbro_1407 [Gordonia bronchialis DSM 43247]|uniref:Uncharacterized protein n=1 Tax=Gordonia bronchialis (strain ATCC 25592 / DSM 43247 / BCRC 13721 / JCM 3198 / KCTC 3076 / NBRC 16047 / NCTC 10667) TaxID=526226 RepID=D0L6D2_GORB4|nr:hypothetical protein [Gordonia bronchialis]ACY20689.1 hypothetical protein Gbro_1407 [Gordonia bronchialis DSM 43247]STQ63518.1 Uncharacterised protein [Gordonia bronchialis]
MPQQQRPGNRFDGGPQGRPDGRRQPRRPAPRRRPWLGFFGS